MGNAFSGPDAFKFFGFTPKATAVLQADPFLLVILLLTLSAIGSLIGLGFFINYITGKPYKKPKKDGEKSKGLLGGIRGALRV